MTKRTERSALGVLYTGYLEKFNPDGWTEKAKRRFVVLTHVGLHWFKREEGYDLFGEEKGYVLVQEMRGVDQDASSPTQFYIETTDTYRRGLRASSKQECEQWVAAISCAIRNRMAYRRETLTGLSFLPTGDTDSIRPSILLASVLQGGSSREEVIVARAVKYGKLLSDLPDLQAGDRVVFTLADGSTASIEANDLQGGPKQVKAKLLGVSPGSFESSSSNGGKDTAMEGGAGSSSSVVEALMRPETLISVVLIAFLMTICVASAGTHPPFMSQVEHAAMLVTMLGLAAQILVPLLLPITKGPASEATRTTTQALPPVAIKVEEYVVEHGIEDVDGAGAEEEDADLENAANTIPKRFVDGMNGDMTEALRRWKETIKWRKSYGTSKMLDEPVPYFDLIKECYPHYYCLTGREGDPVYIERSGQVNQPRLSAAGCTVDMLVRHYIWCTEYLYTHLHPRETAKTITLFDVKGVGLRDLAGDAFDFLRKSATMIQEHYPERAKVILIVNSPGWFSFLWKMIKPFVHENTQKKVKILKGGKETFEGVCEFVDPKNIPVEYGGELTFGNEPDNCRWKSPEEVKMREYAEAVNKKHGVEMIKG